MNSGIQGKARNLAHYLHHKQSTNVITLETISKAVIMEDHNLGNMKEGCCYTCWCKQEQRDERKHLQSSAHYCEESNSAQKRDNDIEAEAAQYHSLAFQVG